METLTLEEKLRLLSGVGAWHTYDCNGKLPSILMTDGPHGLRKEETEQVGTNNKSKRATCFPTASAIACSWDVDVVAKMAAAIAREALAEQVSIVLGCGVNIKRSPLCGRNFEYFSEDPFLTGTLAASYINAMQELGVGTSLKHFAGNSQETNRQTSNSQIDERTLREIYLSAFEMVVKKAKPATIMASYNRLNGEYACANKRLLTNILREEWGFEGAVISDWGATADVVKCMKAGMDLEMPDSNGIHTKQLRKALTEGKITEEEIDRAVNKVRELIIDQAAKLKKDMRISYEEHHKLALELECESAVLLKNNGMLPLAKEAKVLVVGEMAVNMRFQGGGSSHINTAPTKNALRSLQDTGCQLEFCRGYHADTDAVDEKLEKEALEAAASGLPILFFGGLTEQIEGEGYDRTSLSIPANQIRLLEKLYQVNQKIAFIAFGGSAMELPFLNKVKAVLQMYLGGQAVGEACAKLLTGEVNPSGKLAETFPISLKDVPSYHYFGRKSDDVEYRESLFVGYRYYESYHRPVQFCFGHGLSYTSFSYSGLTLNTKQYQGGELTVTCKVKNTGTRFGKEVIQVYVKNPECNYLRPLKELRGFTKVSLQPGEEKEVSVILEERSFCIYDEGKSVFLMPTGKYEILVGASVKDIRLQTDLIVCGEDYRRDDRIRLKEYFHQTEEEFHITKGQFEILYGRTLSNFDCTRKGEFTIFHSLEQLAKHSLLGKIVLAFSTLAVMVIHRGKSADDPEVRMMKSGIREGMLDSVICQSGGMIPYKVGEAIVLSANGHHRKAVIKLFKRNK